MDKSGIGSRKFTRRTFLVGATALASIPILSACAAAATTPATSKSLAGSVTTWVYPLAGTDQTKNEDAWKTIVQGFNATNSGVKLDVQVLPWTNRNEKLTTAIAAGAGPDTAYLNEDFVPQHAGDGNIDSLDTLLADVKDDYLPNALTTATFDGKLHIAPILMSCTSMVYNSKLFTDAGVATFPTNWDELLQVAPQFKAKGLYAVDYPGALEQSLNLTYYPLLWQAGGDVLTEDGKKPAFNGPEGLAALNFVRTLFDKEYTNKSSSIVVAEQGRSQLETSKAAIGMVTDNNAAKTLSTTWGAGALKLGAPMKNKKQVSYGTVAGWALFKASKNKESTGAWIKYMVAPDTMKQILAMGSYFSPRKSLGALYGGDPILGEMEKFLPMMHGGTRHRAARPIISAMAPEIQAAFLGKKSPEQALADAEKEVVKLLQG